MEGWTHEIGEFFFFLKKNTPFVTAKINNTTQLERERIVMKKQKVKLEIFFF